MQRRLEMWWNFIGRSQQDIEEGRKDWMEGTRFGEVHGFDGAPLPAPELSEFTKSQIRCQIALGRAANATMNSMDLSTRISGSPASPPTPGAQRADERFSGHQP
jgi:hypothetical protein